MQKKTVFEFGGLCRLALGAGLTLCSFGMALDILMAGTKSSTAYSNSAFGTASTPVGNWSIVPSPNTDTTQYNQLFGVACPASNDCWAAGYLFNGSHSQTLTEHWDGNAWSIAPSANTAASDSNFLLGITCNSSNDCWAVGHHDTGAVAVFSTLIEHYDGVSWSVLTSPNVTQGQDNELTGIACTAADNCWTVGYYSIGNPALPTGTVVYQTLIEHWDGNSWSITSSPNSSAVDNNILHDVACVASDQCWAVGSHYNSVSGVMTLIEKFDGTSWAIVASANPSANQNTLLGIACTPAANCRAVGSVAVGNVQQNLTERYDGTSWMAEDSASTDPGQSNFPYAISCNSNSDCWAVGSYFNFPGSDVLTLIDHYDGTNWSVVSSPNPPPNAANQHTDFLTRVTCTSTTDCWAVGYYFNSNGVTQNLIEHYRVPAIEVSAIVSRKTHGDAGTFDIDLTSGNGIECRSGGANGEHTLVFIFPDTLNAVGSVAATATSAGGTAPVTVLDTSGIGTDARQYVVNLRDVPNASHLNVALDNATDSAGRIGSVSATMDVLLGDVNASGNVDAADVGQVQRQNNKAVTSTPPANFRMDVNVSGDIDAADVGVTQRQNSKHLP